MAEFCLDCWNKINKTTDTTRKYILSDDLEMCEECDQWKHVIVIERKAYWANKLFGWFFRLQLQNRW